MECEECKTTVAIPFGGLGSLGCNQFLESLVRSLPPPNRSLASRQTPCDACDTTTASMNCGVCDQNFCTGCSKSHSRMKASASHTQHPLQEVAVGTPVVRQRIPHCERHPEMQVDVLCKTCRVTICSRCILPGHENHSIALLTNEVDPMKEDIVCISLKAGKMEEKATKAEEAISGAAAMIEECVKQGNAEVERVRELLHAAVEAQCEIFSNEIQARGQKRKAAIQKDQYKASLARLQYNGLRGFTEGLLVQGTPTEITGVYKMVCQSKTLFSLT